MIKLVPIEPITAEIRWLKGKRQSRFSLSSSDTPQNPASRRKGQAVRGAQQLLWMRVQVIEVGERGPSLERLA